MGSGPGTPVLIMRHGPAESLGLDHASDADRRLTRQGRARTEKACRLLASLLPELGSVYTSPYVRARETAELLASAFSLDTPQITPLLEPGFDPVMLARMLAGGDGRPVALVGHEPDLSALVAWLTGAHVHMDKGTACLTELARPGGARLFALYQQPALLNLTAED